MQHFPRFAGGNIGRAAAPLAMHGAPAAHHAATGFFGGPQQPFPQHYAQQQQQQQQYPPMMRPVQQQQQQYAAQQQQQPFVGRSAASVATLATAYQVTATLPPGTSPSAVTVTFDEYQKSLAVDVNGGPPRGVRVCHVTLADANGKGTQLAFDAQGQLTVTLPRQAGTGDMRVGGLSAGASQAGAAALAAGSGKGVVALPPGSRVGFVTDVEGNVEYFRNYCKKSTVIDLIEPDTSGVEGTFRLELRPDCFFVHGGDVCDKGPGDIRVTRALTDLKKRHPDRVFLIMGNRDFNKLRLTSDLGENQFGMAGRAGRELADVPGCYWLAPEKRKSAEMFVHEQIAKSLGLEKGADGASPLADLANEEIEALESEHNTPLNRLKWMLRDTMGCPETFEDRRAELRILSGKEIVGDEEVFQSFVRSMEAGGWMLDYLLHGQLALVLGNTLFVHGGLNADNIGYVPGPTSTRGEMDQSQPGDDPHGQVVAGGVRNWVSALNAWYDEQMQQHLRCPKYAGLSGGPPRGGDSLMDYGVEKGHCGRTVVYVNFLVNGHGTLPGSEVDQYLQAAGVERVLVGHAPHGQSPLVMRSPQGVDYLACDSSYSDMKAKSNAPRGQAASAVTIVKDADGNESVNVDGQLADGTKIAFDVAAGGGGDPFVGRETTDGFWVKARIADGEADAGKYVLCKEKGFVLEHETVASDALESRL